MLYFNILFQSPYGNPTVGLQLEFVLGCKEIEISHNSVFCDPNRLKYFVVMVDSLNITYMEKLTLILPIMNGMNKKRKKNELAQK